jgi:TfoX/Sxy family transcriptional regulator of competence genes
LQFSATGALQSGTIAAMAVDHDLRSRIGAYLESRKDVTEKSIVGGRGFTWRGNLVCGVMGDDLLVRVGKTLFDELVSRPGARPMTMAGRQSKAWICVDGTHVTDDASLVTWLDHAINFTASLPPKAS